jgi:hypothetical protein
MPAAGSVSIILFIIYSLIDKLPRIHGDETGKESNLRRGGLAHAEPSSVSVVIVGMSRSLCYERTLRRGRGLDFGASLTPRVPAAGLGLSNIGMECCYTQA